MDRSYFLEKLTQRTSMSTDLLPGVPVVEIGDDRRVLVENHQGVTEYDVNRIQVKVRYGSLCVSGDKLELVSMTKTQLVIRGRIENVCLVRGG